MSCVPDAARPVRVLFVEQAVAFGGAFVVIAELIRRLRRDRVQTVMVTAMDAGFVEERLGAAAPTRAVRHTFDYVRMTRLTRRLSGLGLPRRLAGYLVTGLAAVANLGYSFRLMYIVRRERPDVIHVNNGTEHIESNWWMFLVRARRCVVHAHGAGTSSRLQRMFLNRVARVIAISDAVREGLEYGGVDPERIVVVPNPVALPDRGDADPAGAKARTRKQYGIPDDAVVFGIFGRFVRWKGHREFLLAAAEVIRSVPNAYAMVVGGAADMASGRPAELRGMARELGIENRVVFTGYVSDVTSHYHAVDVVVHCSIEPEPFGLVLIEAMACGVPVIAANRGAPLEIITHGVDGLLVDPECTDLLGLTIRDLLGNTERRRELADRARTMVLRRYDADRYARRLEAIYLEVAGALPADAAAENKAPVAV